MDRNVFDLDANIGKLVWDYTTGDWVLSSSSVANGAVYVESFIPCCVYAIGNQL